MQDLLLNVFGGDFGHFAQMASFETDACVSSNLHIKRQYGDFMKKILFTFLFICTAAVASQIRPVISPRVISVITNNQDGRGNQFRATVIRQGDEDKSNLSVVIEQINYADGGAGSILAQLIIAPNKFKYGKDTSIRDLKMSESGFSFRAESMSTDGKPYVCIFPLPEEPAYGAQPLTLSSLNCQQE
jgi:hypothetical protein